MAESVAMLALAAVCWLFRISFVLLIPPERLPARVHEALTYLAPAVLGRMVSVELASVLTLTDPTDSALVLGATAFAAFVALGSATSPAPFSSVCSPSWRSTC